MSFLVLSPVRRFSPMKYHQALQINQRQKSNSAKRVNQVLSKTDQKQKQLETDNQKIKLNKDRISKFQNLMQQLKEIEPELNDIQTALKIEEEQNYTVSQLRNEINENENKIENLEEVLNDLKNQNKELSQKIEISELQNQEKQKKIDQFSDVIKNQQTSIDNYKLLDIDHTYWKQKYEAIVAQNTNIQNDFQTSNQIKKGTFCHLESEQQIKIENLLVENEKLQKQAFEHQKIIQDNQTFINAQKEEINGFKKHQENPQVSQESLKKLAQLNKEKEQINLILSQKTLRMLCS